MRHFLRAAGHLFDAVVGARAVVFGVPAIVGGLLFIVSLMNSGHPEAEWLRMVGQLLMLLALLGMFATRGLSRSAWIRSETDRRVAPHPALDHLERAGEHFRDVAATATDAFFGMLGIVGLLIVLANGFSFSALLKLHGGEAAGVVLLGFCMIFAALFYRAARPDPEQQRRIREQVAAVVQQSVRKNHHHPPSS